jgi:serine/threonine protein kinase
MAPEPLTLFDIVPGREIAGRYTIVGPSRQGGFSTAFRVDDADGSPWEMQLFPSGLFDADGQSAQFSERLRPLIDVDSPAILGVREILEIDAGSLALITELPTGESLRERLNREKIIKRDAVLAIGCALLEGLEQLHASELVHGDIKPYTIHVSGEGAETKPVLVDGGVTPGLWMAKDLGEKTALIGTPYYAPVEQFGGDAPDSGSDLYNVATVLYECAAGALPWAGSTFLEVFQAKLTDPPPMTTRVKDVEVADDLDQAIRRGCLADRRERYESAAEFREVLDGLR